jgi:quercetin dioxygenase-like cupin family protein
LADFGPEDYVFDLFDAADNSASGVAAFNAGTSKALFGTFISGVVINFDKCAINLPHVHPRATEIALVLEGELEMGFIMENGLTP